MKCLIAAIAMHLLAGCHYAEGTSQAADAPEFCFVVKHERVAKCIRGLQDPVAYERTHQLGAL